jgi:hypothetical protein
VILCSGGLYQHPLTQEECLGCALRGENRCGYGYRLLKAIFSTREERPDVHVTDLVACLRKAYLNKKEPVPEYVHHLLTRWIGVAIHDALEIHDENVESEIALDKDGLVGRVDAVFGEDIEDTKTKRWMYPNACNSKADNLQVNIYRQLLGKEGGLRIQYIDMSGPTKCNKCRLPVEYVDGILACPTCGNEPKNAHLGALMVDVPVEDVSEFIRTRSQILGTALATNEMPDGEPSYLCKGYCPFTFCEHHSSYQFF